MTKIESRDDRFEKVKRPPQFMDFFKPSPFERPWMLPYLPNNSRSRDFIIVIFGCSTCLLISWLLIEAGLNEDFSAYLGLAGVAIFLGESLGRNKIAGIKLGQAKKKSLL